MSAAIQKTSLFLLFCLLITSTAPGASAAPTHRYVDASVASSGDGLSWATAWKSIQEAAGARLAPGTTIHIAPGIYRETIIPQQGGTAAAPITYRAENGPGTVFVLGSETVGTLGASWQSLSDYAPGLSLQPGVNPGDIFFIEAPWEWQMDWDPGFGTTFPIETDRVALPRDGSYSDIISLPQAREPDWAVDVVHQHHANWWAADGGASGLDASNPSDSNNYLMDTASDHTRDLDGDGQADFPNIPPGNLQSVFPTAQALWDPRADAYPGDPTRQNPLLPTILFSDGRTGHYTPRFNILDYNPATGVIRLDNPRPGEGPDGEGHFITERTKFYLQGAPGGLDCPGEWVHHDGRIFLLTGNAAAAGCGVTLTQADLANLEFSRRFSLLQLGALSHLRFEDLDFAFNNTAKYGYYYGPGQTYPPYLNYPAGAIDIDPGSGALTNVIFDGITIRHAATGIYAGYPGAESAFTVQNSVFSHIDGTAIQVQAPDSGGWEGIGILNNQFEGLGFRPQIGEGTGLSLSRVGHLRFLDNHLQAIAHNGVQFHQGWGAYISQDILVMGNTVEGACRMAYDCGGLKFHGGGKGYQDILVMGNISRDHIGWSYAAWMMELPYRQSEPGGWWPHTVLGELGMGVYLDYASGVTIYRNLLVGNSAAGVYFTGNYREHQPNFVVHNTIAHTLDGVHFGNSFNGFPHTNSRLLGNIFLNCENAGTHYAYSSGDTYNDPDLTALNLAIDYNLYKPYPDPPDQDPWPGYDPTWYDPAVLEYLTSGNRWEPYRTLAFLQDHTDWETHGTTWQSDQPLVVNEAGSGQADYALAEYSVAIDEGLPATPAEVTALMSQLSASLGAPITDETRLGTAYDAGAFEYFPLEERFYLPAVMRQQ
jgi:hypothetical protein